MEHPWCSLHGSWWMVVSFRLFLDGLWGSRWFPRCHGSPGAVGPGPSVFTLICEGFKGYQSEIEVKST